MFSQYVLTSFLRAAYQKTDSPRKDCWCFAEKP